MSLSNLPEAILKIGLAFAKYHIKNVIGDDALEIVAATLADVGGEKVQVKVDAIFASKEGQKILQRAAKSADTAFRNKCRDSDLLQLFTMEYGSLPSVQAAIVKLPVAADDESLRETIFTAFRNDAPARIGDEKIREGVDLYIECLQSALLPVKDFGLRIIHTALKEIGKDVKDIREDVRWLRRKAETSRRDAAGIMSGFLVPFPRNEKFVGREDDLKALHETLQRGGSVGVHPAMLSGMGGIGKTQLAVEYAYRYAAKYPGGIYWVNAARDLLLDGMAEAAEKIGLGTEGVPESQRLTHLANAFAQHLDSHPGALVIFDNVENPQVLRMPLASFIPSELKCSILFTTRRRDLASTFYHSFEVTVLPESAAMQLLLRHPSRRAVMDPGHAEHAWAHIICMTLGCLPLAIELAGAYLGKYSEIPLQDYRYRLLDEGAMETVDATELHPEDLPTRHDTAISATLKLSWEAIQDEPDARLALKAAGQLHEAELISLHRLSLLTGLAIDAKPGYPPALGSALKKLFEFSLIEELTSENLRLHPMVFAFAAGLAGEDLRIQMADHLAQSLCTDVETLNQLVARYGIDAVLADVRTALWLYSDHSNEQKKDLSVIDRLLDGEAHHVRDWESQSQPAFLVQQLYTRAMECGLTIWQKQLKAWLGNTRHGWLCKKNPTLLESAALLRTLSGHHDIIWAVAVTPDGSKAISASRDSTLKIWDLASGQELRTLSGHGDSVFDVAVTPDGRLVVSASSDRTLKVWDLASGQELRTLSGHADEIGGVAVTPDGSQAVSASWDRTLKVWNLKSGQEVRTLSKHGYYVLCAAVTPDGRLVVSGSSDKTLKVWDLASGQELQTLSGHGDSVHNVAISPDGRLVVSASGDSTLKVWDISRGKELRTLQGHRSQVNGVAITADGRFAVSASDDRSLRVWDLARGRELRTLLGHREIVKDVSVTPNGLMAVSASVDHTLKVWDLTREQEGMQPGARHRGKVNEVAITSDSRLAVSASEDNTLKIWDIASGREMRTLSGHKYAVSSVAITPDGRKVISASNDSTLKVWDLARGRELRTLTGHAGPVIDLAIDQDGRLAVSVTEDHTLKMWNLPGGQELLTLSTPRISHGPHGRGFRRPRERSPESLKYVTALSITPDGRLAVCSSSDGTLDIWDLQSKKKIHTMQGHNAKINKTAVSPDGRLIVSASEDASLKVWELATGQVLLTLKGHRSGVCDVAVSLNGSLVASASEDETLRVWDLKDGKELLILASNATFTSIAITPDCKSLVAGDGQGFIHFIDMISH